MEPNTDWSAVAEELVPILADHAARHDREGTFVEESYAALRERRVMSMLVPTELGGGGATIRETCELLRTLAGGCPSTALALSMHTHVVAVTAWKHREGKPVAALLRRIASEQLVIVSTGGTDWVDSVGEMRKVDGGYRVTARKVFASGAPAAALLATSARYDDPELGPRVLHFAVPFHAEGVERLDDWDTLGMRGTGSQTVLFRDVFVPEGAIALSRPRGEWHDAWSVVVAVAPAIYMSPYVGLAEHAARVAREAARSKADQPHVASLVGEMENARTAMDLAWRAMLETTAELDFAPSLERAERQLVYKTLVTNAAHRTVQHALRAAGGRGFFRKLPIERAFRDVQAAHFHPLPEHRQVELSGRLALGRDPITNAALSGTAPVPAPRLAGKDATPARGSAPPAA